MKKYIYLFATLFLLICSCTDRNEEELQEFGRLSINVTLSSLSSQSKAPIENYLVEGDGMEDVTILLVNSKNVVTFIESINNLVGTEQESKVVTSESSDLKLGQYSLYAFGNLQNTGFTEVRSIIYGLKQGDILRADFNDLLFQTLDGTNTPVFNNEHPMLLSASKLVNISMQNNSTTIELVRPVVKFEVRLYNNSMQNMTVNNLSFSSFNASTGYVLSHDGNMPASINYRNLPAYDTNNPISVGAGENATIYESVLFENRAPSYMMNMSLQVSKDEVGVINNSQMKIINRLTGEVVPMTEQLRNQHIIVTINAYYNKHENQFKFDVVSWENKEENIEFN